MYHKLEEKAIEGLLEAGIQEFSEKGLDRANINTIAKSAGVSVGVIYKYYEDKDKFFLACVDYSLMLLENAMSDVMSSSGDFRGALELLVNDLIDGAEKHRSYYVMYNEITSGSCRKYASMLAAEIETRTARIYTSLIDKAQKEGSVKVKGDPGIFAFFFDNLLMMLQFSFSCEYYRERMKIFCGSENISDTQKIKDVFIDFLTRAFEGETEDVTCNSL